MFWIITASSNSRDCALVRYITAIWFREYCLESARFMISAIIKLASAAGVGSSRRTTGAPLSFAVIISVLNRCELFEMSDWAVLTMFWVER